MPRLARLSFGLLLVASACAATHGHAGTPSPGKEPLLISLTAGKEDLHRATMAFMLADKALAQGRSTTVFLSVHAPVLAARTLPADTGMPGEKPIAELVADFVAHGGHLLVCQHCAKIDGVLEADLVQGARMIDGGAVLGGIAPGTVVLSY